MEQEIDAEDIQNSNTVPNKQKYIAIVLDDDNNITFSVEGLTVDESLIAVTKGAIKFRKVYEANIIGG